MRVGGFVRLSTVDWPGNLVATVFTRGCPWDCPYCHNPHLLSGAPADSGGETADAPSWSEILAFLRTRAGLLDGIVFTGGEPTAQPSLADAVREVRELGFSVGLHSGGSLPERFAEVLPLVDWVGFDVKAPFAEYERVTRVAGSGEWALSSLRALVASGVAFEARTTVHPDLLSDADLERLAVELEREGVRDWALQAYRSEGVRPGTLAPAVPDLSAIAERLRSRFATLSVR